jgi:hypothetical protein
MWWFVLAVLLTTVVLAGVWAGRRQQHVSLSSEYGNHRLGVRDPRDTPWGPSGGI